MQQDLFQDSKLVINVVDLVQDLLDVIVLWRCFDCNLNRVFLERLTERADVFGKLLISA